MCNQTVGLQPNLSPALGMPPDAVASIFKTAKRCSQKVASDKLRLVGRNDEQRRSLMITRGLPALLPSRHARRAPADW